ncbi:MAG: MBL fold metallo-hydrolase [Planctomycetota bacterium]
MRITVWGARGSVPVSGRNFVRHGGDTTCVEVRTRTGEVVILDAGTGLRNLGNLLLAEDFRHIHFLLTHAHWDHLLGFPFFKPLFRKGVTLHFHGCMFAQRSIKAILRQTMKPPFFPVSLRDVGAKLVFDGVCRRNMTVGGMCVQSLLLNHPNMGFGFRLTEGKRSLAFFPDNELTFAHPDGKSFAEYARFVRGTDVLIHDAEYTPAEYARYSRGWGHSIYLDTVRLGVDAGVGRLVLWHLNQEHSDAALDAMERRARAFARHLGSRLRPEMARTGMVMDVGIGSGNGDWRR